MKSRFLKISAYMAAVMASYGLSGYAPIPVDSKAETAVSEPTRSTKPERSPVPAPQQTPIRQRIYDENLSGGAGRVPVGFYGSRFPKWHHSPGSRNCNRIKRSRKVKRKHRRS